MRAFLALALVLLAGPLAAQDFSRHCTEPKEGAGLVDGSYDGTFSMSSTFSTPVGPGTLVQTIQGSGDFKVTLVLRAGGSGSRGEGRLNTRTAMNWAAMGAQSQQQMAGTGLLKLEGEVSAQSFRLKASHTTSGVTTSSGYGQSQSVSQTLTDDVTLEMVADEADCNHARGALRSDSVASLEDSMRSAGYSVERGSWTWEMKRTEDASDKIKALRDELQKKAPAGTYRSREAEGRRLAKIADRIKFEETEELQACLFPIWLAHAEQESAQWVAQDAPKVASFNGDWGALQGLIRQALDADRSLALTGRDTCWTNLHKDLWDAIRQALSRHLERMASGQAPISQINQALKQAELLGAVSPGLSEQVWATLRQEATQKADLTYSAYQAALKSAIARGVPTERRLVDPEVQKALVAALNAERAANAAGVEIHRMVK